jgi:hypothetical protein
LWSREPTSGARARYEGAIASTMSRQHVDEEIE